MPRGIRRQPITENPKLQNKNIRGNLQRQMKLDSSIYEEIHKDKKLMKWPDSSPMLHWWLQNGAEPVPRATEKMKIFKGINDKFDSEWVTWPSGTAKGGEPEVTYLLMVDPETYDEKVTLPDHHRNMEIAEAMRLGQNASGLEGHLPGGGGVQTYAPNLPTGPGRGFDEKVTHEAPVANAIR
jgi:hypothetical protein